MCDLSHFVRLRTYTFVAWRDQKQQQQLSYQKLKSKKFETACTLYFASLSIMPACLFTIFNERHRRTAIGCVWNEYRQFVIVCVCVRVNIGARHFTGLCTCACVFSARKDDKRPCSKAKRSQITACVRAQPQPYINTIGCSVRISLDMRVRSPEYV